LETSEELRAFVTAATEEEAWGRLQYRGAAWALMRTEGELSRDAPAFGDTIDADLAEHGFALLRASIALRESDGPSSLASKGFEHAAKAFEALVRNGAPDAVERGFYRTLAAACYHLASFSAVAYSLFNGHEEERNRNPAEVAIEWLILRDMERLRRHVSDWMGDAAHGDAALAEALEAGDIEVDEVVATIVNTTICRALAHFDFALQTGETELVEHARALLTGAVDLAVKAENVPLWWIGKICRSLIDDLWSHSLHEMLPAGGPVGGEEVYPRLRQLFIASLFSRKTAEVELWPSQREAAARSADLSDDLVVALPTSAGKTRVAEIAALMTLSTGKRVLIVTPLRALSAQTERSFRKTFSPLGFSVSSLYGASGVSSGDEDALRSRHIVISTPEKLDFALRNDPGLINDIGLIVLDEGHMIGPTEREIRYETLVQRLLLRSDANERRIICLSAILPEGSELDDLTSWIRSDDPGEPVRSDWRPTRLRFGTLIWTGREARLNFDLYNDGPFIRRFVSEMAPRGRDRNSFPRGVSDIAIQAAWEFAAQGKRTLIFSTQANWVEGYGRSAFQFVKNGYLPTLLEDPRAIERALEVGREWLGSTHPAVLALKVGVAIHHGRLPSPFLRELEALLSESVLKIVVASPTLSQGLNLNAAVLLVPYLHRSGQLVSGEEFANVVGRAGRAFVDTEGLILHVIPAENPQRKIRQWRGVVDSIKARSLKSGLIQVVAEIIQRFAQAGVLGRDDAIEYLANSREAWTAADAQSDNPEGPEIEPLQQLVERLDATVFGLVEALDANAEDLPLLLDQALTGSLWARQIVREGVGSDERQKAIILARARLIWRHTTPGARKGHFAMGVGLEAGLAIDGMADELEALVDRADVASLSGDVDELSEALSGLAERLLIIRPFVPGTRNALPNNWRDLLCKWVGGADVEDIGTDRMQMIEDAFIYRLVWALEAIRTRRSSLGWQSEIVSGGGAAALESGVPQLMMAMLIRAGLPSRTAAMAAIEQSDANFATPAGMRAWVASEEVDALCGEGDWPTPETTALWQRFRQNMLVERDEEWTTQRWTRALELEDGQALPPPGIYRIEVDEVQAETWLVTPDFQRKVRFKKTIRDQTPSVWMGRLLPGRTVVVGTRCGQARANWPKTVV
jgi:hypothetical protein